MQVYPTRKPRPQSPVSKDPKDPRNKYPLGSKCRIHHFNGINEERTAQMKLNFAEKWVPRFEKSQRSQSPPRTSYATSPRESVTSESYSRLKVETQVYSPKSTYQEAYSPSKISKDAYQKNLAESTDKLWKPCCKTFMVCPPQARDEVIKSPYKSPPSTTKLPTRDPIVKGDEPRSYSPRGNEFQNTQTLHNINTRKFFLPSDRGGTPQCKVSFYGGENTLLDVKGRVYKGPRQGVRRNSPEAYTSEMKYIMGFGG